MDASKMTNINIDSFAVRVLYRRIIALYPDILYKLCWVMSATLKA
jgi:hypothetical protein